MLFRIGSITRQTHTANDFFVSAFEEKSTDKIKSFLPYNFPPLSCSKKHKASCKKYKALILKYMPYILK